MQPKQVRFFTLFVGGAFYCIIALIGIGVKFANPVPTEEETLSVVLISTCLLLGIFYMRISVRFPFTLSLKAISRIRYISLKIALFFAWGMMYFPFIVFLLLIGLTSTILPEFNSETSSLILWWTLVISIILNYLSAITVLINWLDYARRCDLVDEADDLLKGIKNLFHKS